MKTLQERFEEKFVKTDDCWNWSACKDKQGYGFLRLEGRSQLAHRVSYQMYIGKIPDGLCVCHKCDNPSCVNPSHLFLGTNADNVHDRENKGRGADHSGEKHGRAKMTSVQVASIMTRRGSGARNADLAREFGVTGSTISKVVYGRTWKRTQAKEAGR